MKNAAKMEQLREEILALKGWDLIEIHGWLIGVVVAIERQRASDPSEIDRLIAELRKSKLSDFVGQPKSGVN